MPVAHPGEVQAAVDRVGESRDLGIAREALAGAQDAAEEQRRVDRRDLALPLTRSSVHVDPVIEPAAMMLEPIGEGPQRRARAQDGLLPRHPAALGGDAQAGETEPHRGDAAHLDVVVARRRAIGPRSIADDAGGRVGLLPEELKRPLRQILEKGLLGGGERRPRRPGRPRRRLRGQARRQQQRRDGGKTASGARAHVEGGCEGSGVLEAGLQRDRRPDSDVEASREVQQRWRGADLEAGGLGHGVVADVRVRRLQRPWRVMDIHPHGTASGTTGEQAVALGEPVRQRVRCRTLHLTGRAVPGVEVGFRCARVRACARGTAPRRRRRPHACRRGSRADETTSAPPSRRRASWRRG